jgi:transcriptional regulator with XRE-family HTH domain
MNTPLMASYLRSHRLKSGLTQRELAELVGLIAHHQVSQHERSIAIPSLLAALSYQAIFGIPIIELFPGAYEAIRANVEDGLHRIEKTLQDSSVKGRAAEAIARKLEWLWERRNLPSIDLSS